MRVFKFLSSEFALKSLHEKRLKISSIHDLNDPFELLPFDLSNKEERRALHRARNVLTADKGLLCFSASWRDPVIWAHYSDKHRGLCLGFEVPDATAKIVTYLPERLPFPVKPLNIGHSETMLFTKFINWEYEKEMRVWAELKDEENGLYFKDFGPDLQLLEVIAGAECEISAATITCALKPLAGINLIKARAGFKEFEIVTDKRGMK